MNRNRKLFSRIMIVEVMDIQIQVFLIYKLRRNYNLEQKSMKHPRLNKETLPPSITFTKISIKYMFVVYLASCNGRNIAFACLYIAWWLQAFH